MSEIKSNYSELENIGSSLCTLTHEKLSENKDSTCFKEGVNSRKKKRSYRFLNIYKHTKRYEKLRANSHYKFPVIQTESKSFSNGTYIEEEKPIIEGWLQKWTNILNTWKPRYFQLFPGLLCYTKGSKVKKRFLLNHETCFIDLSSNDSFRISIKYPSDSDSDLHLRAFSFESKLVWTNALLYSISVRIPTFGDGNSSPLNPTTIFSPLSDLVTDETISFLPNLLYELIKTRNLLLDEISERRKRRYLKSTVSKYFDKFIGTVFDITYKKFYLSNLCESDIYSALLKSIKFNKESDLSGENFTTNTFFDSLEETFYDAHSDVESIYSERSERMYKCQSNLPKEDDCSTCFWNMKKYVYRKSLPFFQQKPRFSLWGSIKESISKDISRITIPIQFNEPTSLLQRLAEDFMYSSIIEKASSLNQSIDRLREVTIFSITPYASSVGRVYKPFNPLLGETFEFSHRGFRFIAEQVGHHPPVTAFHVEHHPTALSTDIPKIGHNDESLYSVWGQVGNKSRFTGQSLELAVIGNVNVKINGKNDHFSFNKPKLLIHNIIFGKIWLEIVGITTIVNHSTSEFSLVEYQKSGWFSNDLFNIRGLVFNKYAIPIYKIGGKWDTNIWYETCKNNGNFFKEYLKFRGVEFERKSEYAKGNNVNLSSSDFQDSYSSFIHQTCFYTYALSNWDKIETIINTRKFAWSPEAKPSQSDKYFGFSNMSFELNEISPQYDKHAPGVIMPSTDSRYRPDQRAYESGCIEWAIKEKRRLEEKQRANAKKRINGEADYSPKWFYKEFNDSKDKYTWKFNHKYWVHKDKKINFSDLPNIF
ncbi:hypothetical protein FG386_000750 [Cryptosporidium ryanae]|uniref:uncharacterized protein n=1 Tax=Cryptosporidium ryanae TaxID=515981 RepID=UPI00351A6428|nr:hypothetical protein FG386_000750 [Cryptosporidium ryanae]